MKKRIAALAACAVLSLTAATAEPALVTDRHLAWIGEMNYLYIADATGAIKRLGRQPLLYPPGRHPRLDYLQRTLRGPAGRGPRPRPLVPGERRADHP